MTSLSSLPFFLLLMFWETLKPTEPEDTTTAAIEGMARSDSCDVEACAAILALLEKSDISNLEHISSLWPGLNPPGSCAGSAGRPTAF